MRDGWRQVAISDICILTKGTTATQKAVPGRYPLVVTAAEFASSDQYQFDGEAVCVPLVSSTGHGHASLKRVHYAAGQFAVASLLTALEARPGAEINMKFLWHLLHHRRDEVIVPLMRGTANVSLSQGALAAATVWLPPLDEQRRIVDLVGEVDGVLDSARELMREDTYAHLLRAVDAKFPHRPIAELVTRAYAGGTPSRKRPEFFGGDIPWLKSGEVENDLILSTEEHLTAEGLAGSSARLVPAGATVVAMYGATRGKVGQLAVPLTTNQAVLALIADETVVGPRLLMHAVRASADALEARGAGAAQPNLSKGVVLSHGVPVPPLEEQEAICEALDAALAARGEAEQLTTELSLLRSHMLTVLLSGEHEIPASYDDLMEGVAV